MAEKKGTAPRPTDEFGADSLRVATAVGAMAGLGLVLFAIIFALVSQSWSAAFYAPWWMLGVGLLAIIFFVFFNFEWLTRIVTGRAALSGISVAVLCVGAVALWLCGNLLFNHPGRFNFRVWKRSAPKTKLYWSRDCTKNKRFELSDKTLAELARLEETLHIYVIYRAGPDEGPMLDDLLQRYAEASEKVQLEFLMPGDKTFMRKHKDLAKRLHKPTEQIERRSVIMFYGKDRFKYLSPYEFWEQRPVPRFGGQVGYDRVFKGEEVLTSAIYGMVDKEKTKVYFIVDHGERSPDDRTTMNGMYGATLLLKRDNIDWETADLKTWEKVPDDATVVALCGPRRPIHEREAGVLTKYLDDRRGRLLICLDDFQPDVDLGLDGLLEHVGLQAGRDIVIEKNAEYKWARVDGLYIGRDMGFQPQSMLGKLREANVRPSFRGACTVGRMEGYSGKYSPQNLCSGSSDSYGETDFQSYVKGRAALDENADNKGPVVYAIASWEGPPPMPGGRMQIELGRVVLVGDSDWCSDRWMSSVPDNCSFFMAVINWLAGKEKRIEIQPKLADNERYNLKPQHRKMSVIVLVIVPVLLFLAAGVVLWIRRR
ncbi:MAG: hypothetical protein ACYTGB_14870 [Planctomycetota bacterium]|jgi:ABC-2 type transport system permease protein